MKNSNLKIIIIGNKNLAVECLEHLLQTKENIVGVICNHDDDYLIKSWYKSLKASCLKNHLRHWQPKTCNAPEFIEEIKKENPDVIFSFSYNKIMKKDFIQIPRLGIFNFHFAKLPKYRGCLPVVYALASNDKSIGITFHQIDEGIDTGPIIDQRLIKIAPDDTAYSLYFECVQIAKNMFVKNFELIKKGQIKKITQKLNEGSYNKQVYPQNRWINWHARAEEIDRFIRALTFPGYPAARTIINNQEIEILPPVKILKSKKNEKIPGQILTIKNDSIIVATGKDSLILSKFRIKNSEFKAPAITGELKLSKGNIFISNYPRILHVGNIANNAYLNSKLLRNAGFESDVLCYDYYHVMGTPEWEDAKFIGDYGSDFVPNFSGVITKKYKRPKWFYQDSLENIARKYFSIDPPTNNLFLSKLSYLLDGIRVIFYKKYLRAFDNPSSRTFRLKLIFLKMLMLPIQVAIVYLKWANNQLDPQYKKYQKDISENRRFYEQLILDFKRFFPEREDKLTYSDILKYLYRTYIFKNIFTNYDIVQGYATDPIYALLANKHPYVAFEHGTIREIPFENSSLGRLTALAYRKADLVFITNADNRLAAKKLGLKNFVGVPHPIDDFWHKKIRPKIKKEKKQEIILFCPIRHDWEIKGTDLYIRALPQIIKDVKTPFKIIFIEWGMEIEKSKKLIKQLKVEKYVQWVQSLPRYKFATWMEKADIILDQLTLPHMGATAPEGMLASKPVLMSYKPESTDWMFPMAPIVSVFTVSDIAEAIKNLLNNPDEAKQIGLKGPKWFYKYYSKKVVLKKLIFNYDRLLKKGQK